MSLVSQSFKTNAAAAEPHLVCYDIYIYTHTQCKVTLSFPNLIIFKPTIMSKR